MTPVSLIWPMISAACLTLALLHFFVWLKQRDMWASFFFSVFSASTALFALLELFMMKAQTPEQWGWLLRWVHVPTAILLISMVWFVRLYLRAGRTWLAWTLVALRILTLALNFILVPNLNFSQLTALRQVPFLGDTVSVPTGVTSLWALVGNAGLLLAVVFVMDAAVTTWRREEKRRALVVGGTILLFTLCGAVDAVLVMWGFVVAPLAVSPFYLGIVIAMGYEMSLEHVRAIQLAHKLRISETDLRESESRMSLAANFAKLGIWVEDLSRDEIWATEKWRDLFGFAPADRINVNTILQRVHPDDCDAFLLARQHAMGHGDEHAHEFRIVASDGRIRWIASHGLTEYDPAGKPVLMRCVSLDITERKLAQERLRQVVEAVPSAIVMVNPQGIIHLVNAQTETVFGYSRKELVGLPVEMLLPEKNRVDHVGYRRGYAAEPTARLMGVGRELFGRHRDGHLIPVEIGLNPVQTTEGPFILASIIDITQRRQAEQEAQKQRTELAHMARVTVLGELSSSLAHELYQPLGAILRNTEAAEIILQSPSPDLEELRAIVADIRADDRRAGNVIDRLRSLLKKRPLESQEIPVAELAEEVNTFVRADALVRGVRLEVDVPPDLPWVRGDRVHLQQVLLNLIMNAMDAVHDRPHLDRRVLIRALLNPDRFIEVGVTDNGHGIPPDHLSRLFEHFFTTKPNGMGIGLAVSRTIIEAHGGRIWAQNNPDLGATVRFTVPAITKTGRR